MSDGSRPVPEGRRVEALRRLAIPDRLTDRVFLDLLALIGELLVADRIAVTVVDERRARTVAELGPHTPAAGDAEDPATPVAPLAPAAPTDPVAQDGPVAEVARAASFAGLLLRAQPASTVRWSDPASLPGLEHHRWVEAATPPAMVGAASIVGPDGAVVGALEIAWAAADAVPEAWRARAVRAAGQVAAHLVGRAEADEYHRFVDLAPDAIAVLDLEGRLELVNPAMARLLGAQPDALTGRSFLDLIVTSDLGRITGALARVLTAREPRLSVDVHLRRSDGRQVPVSISAGHLAGPRRSVQVVVRDLSERLRAESERARLTEQLAQAHRFETVGQLAGGLAHDLNNLLAVLLANVQLAEESVAGLAAGGSVDDAVAQLREDLSSLGTASRRVEDLTRRLLAFAAESPATVEPLHLATRLAAVAMLLGPSLGEGVALELDVADDLPAVEVDPVAFERVVTNLVLNARDALHGAAGTVRIAAHRDHRADAATGETADVVVLEVRDDGQGMTEEVRSRAFEPLFTTKAGDRGTGLGLATVLRFVEDVGGDLHLDTAPGAGTCVTVVLPLPSPGVPREVADRAGRVVLVEPAERSRRVIAAMLTGGGYLVEAVGSLGEAASRLSDDVQVMVVAVGEDDGAPLPSATDDAAEDQALLAAIAEVAPRLPVVLLTTRHAALLGGADEVLRKPFPSERLLEAVSRAARARSDRNA